MFVSARQYQNRSTSSSRIRCTDDTPQIQWYLLTMYQPKNQVVATAVDQEHMGIAGSFPVVQGSEPVGTSRQSMPTATIVVPVPPKPPQIIANTQVPFVPVCIASIPPAPNQRPPSLPYLDFQKESEALIVRYRCTKIHGEKTHNLFRFCDVKISSYQSSMP